MPKCGVCGCENCLVFYNRAVSEYYTGVKEKITICSYCKSTEIKKEVV
ncbi:MAG: hypothetical protein WCW13_00645 [archaeon]